MVWTVIPEIVEDLAAVPQINGVPEEILYTENINMLEHYLGQKHCVGTQARFAHMGRLLVHNYGMEHHRTTHGCEWWSRS